MPVVKTPEERGPLGAWAYETRVRLGLSVEAVAAALPQPVNPATIRKAEGESRNMSRPLWRQLTTHYARLAREGGATISQPPTYGEAPPDPTALVVALERQTEAITALVARLDVIAEPLGRAVARMLRDQLREANGEPRPAPTTAPARRRSAKSPQGAG